MTAAQLRAIPDCAPATMFAPGPVSPYVAGFENYQERAWFCPWRAGTSEAAQYAAGWSDAKQQQARGLM